MRVAFYSAALAWVNLYICRDLFFIPTAHMNSMHGFWVAIASHAGGSWWRPEWWPYWDNGIPFEFTYAPLFPALMAAWSAVFHFPGPDVIAFQSLTAIVYTLVPLTLFFAAWRLTGAAGSSFAAALFYSLTSPTQLLAPDQGFRWSGFFDSRRLFLVTWWDESPHLLALACLPLVILLLVRAIETGSRRYSAAAALGIAVGTYASDFMPVVTLIAAICLVASLRPEDYRRNAGRVAAIGIVAYAASAAFLPPSLIRAIHSASSNHWRGEPGWTAGSLTALAVVVFGFTVLMALLTRWTGDWTLKFFVLLAYIFTSIPIIDTYLHRRFVPQPGRYKLEAEIGLALAIAFGLRNLFEKMPIPLRRAAIFLVAAVSLEQIVQFRQNEKIYVAPADMGKTVEFRASTGAQTALPDIGARAMLPGSVAQWADAYTLPEQFSGGSWSMAYNPVQQLGLQAIYDGEARTGLAWLKAYGVDEAGVSFPDSQEFWKGFVHPEKFDGFLPKLWSEDGVTIYRVPRDQFADHLATHAHVIPEAALVRRAPRRIDDVTDLERYNSAAALSSLPMQWQGRNRILIHAIAAPDQILSVQVSAHPGWRAHVDGRVTPVFRDGLGLMWLRPSCNGACDVQLDYDGGVELRLCRVLSAATIFSLLVLLAWPAP